MQVRAEFESSSGTAGDSGPRSLRCEAALGDPHAGLHTGLGHARLLR